MTESDILAILPPLKALNSWARLPHAERMDMDCNSAIYWLKNRVIKRAVELGMASIRIVGVERPCKTCKGTGTYTWVDWNDEDNVDYQDCRRCGHTGRVLLRFAETTIAGVRFHTPRPHGAFLPIHPADWEKYESTDWEPEKPGKPLTRPALFRALNEAERIFAGGKLIRWDMGPWRNPMAYHLMLGEVRECFVCGAQGQPTPGSTWLYTHTVYRPGLLWKQFICDRNASNCAERAMRFPRQWPASLYRERCGGRWNDDTYPWKERCPLPSLAHEPYVEEWMARRGIVHGFVPPGEYGFWRGQFVEVKAVKDSWAFVRGTGWLNIGYDRHDLLCVGAADVHGYPRKELTA